MKKIFLLLFAGIALNLMAQPVVSSFSPLTANAGASVTISGSGFNSTASSNIVYFGSVKATTITSASTSQIVVTVPNGAAHQPIRVINTSTSLMGVSNQRFVLKYSGTSTAFTSSKFSLTSITSSTSPAVSSMGTTSSSSYVRRSSGIGDFDGDGKVDVVVIDYSNSQVAIYKNGTTSGSISASNFTKSTVSTASNPRDIEVVDINNDGKLDILVACSTNLATNKISVLINTGSSSISFATKQDINVTTGLHLLKSFDANNDGKLDIIGATRNNDTIIVYPNNMSLPTNTLAVSASVFKPVGVTGLYDIDYGDFNNDGYTDIVAAIYNSSSSSSSAKIFLNTSSGSGISFANPLTLSTGSSIYTVKTADLNLDGNLDIIIGTYNTTSGYVYQNNFSSGTFTTSNLAKVTITNFNASGTKLRTWAIDVADFDGDGLPDIMSSSYASSTAFLSVIKNANSANSTMTAAKFTATTKISGTTSLGLYANVLCVDLDLDGKVDVVSNSDSKIHFLRNAMVATASLNSVVASESTYSSPDFSVNWESSTSGAISKLFTARYSNYSTEKISIKQSATATGWQISFDSINYSSLTTGLICVTPSTTANLQKMYVRYNGITAGSYKTTLIFQQANSSCAGATGTTYTFKCTVDVKANVYKWSGANGSDLNSSSNYYPAKSSSTSNDKITIDAGDSAEVTVSSNSNCKHLRISEGTDLKLTCTKSGGAKIVIDSLLEIDSGATMTVMGSDTMTFEMAPGAKARIRGHFNSESDGSSKTKVHFKGGGEIHFGDNFKVGANTHVKFSHNSEKHVHFDGDDQVVDGDGELEFDEHCHVHFGGGKSGQRCQLDKEIKCKGKITIEDGEELASDAPLGNTENDWKNWSPKLKLTHDGKNHGSISTLAAGSSITGGVHWEMYNSAVRSYRTVAFPLKNPMNLSQITDNLVVSGSYTGANKDSLNNSCSYCLPSAYYWDEPTSSWIAYVGSSNANRVDPGQGILLFFRGMKSYGQGLGDPNAAADPGVIDIKGEIYTGSLTKSLSYASSNSNLKGYNLVGNPYPSNIDFNNLTLNKVANQFAVFDPLAKNYNVWSKSGTTITRTGTTAFTTGPVRLSSIIEAGAAFFAIATGTGASITFDETDKTDSVPNTSAFKEVEKALPCNNLKIALEYADTTKRPYMDQNFMEWDSRYEGAKLDFDDLDMHKIYGGYIGIGTLTSTNEWLGIDRRPFTQSQIQSLPLKIKTYEKVDHVFKYQTCPSGADTLYKVKLVDKVLHKEFDIKDSGVYRFTVSATDTFKENRFDIVVERLFDPQFADVNDPKKELKENMPMGKYAIYPIPVTNGVMNVAGGEDNDIKEVVMTDLQGQVVLKLSSEKTTIGSRISLPNSVKSGIYMVQIKGIKGEINQKVLISN